MVIEVQRWNVPPECQGQIVEYAYGWSAECDGTLYMRVTDRSDRSVTYYRHEDATDIDEDVWSAAPPGPWVSLEDAVAP